MADAGQYAGAASAVFDPQAASENATADAVHANSLADLSNSESKIDPQYADAFKSAAEARASEAARIDFNASEGASGNNTIGLAQNLTRLTGDKYQEEVRKLAGEQAQAHTDIALKKNEENTSYGALRSSIASKYAGLKAGFMQDEADKQNQMDFSAKLQAESEANQRSIAASNNAAAAARDAANNKASGQTGFNNALSSLEDQLRKYQASGYKGSAPSNRAEATSALTRQFGSFVDPGAIQQAVNQTFGRYYIG